MKHGRLQSMLKKKKKTEMLILCPDNNQAKGTCISQLMNWLDRSTKCLSVILERHVSTEKKKQSG